MIAPPHGHRRTHLLRTLALAAVTLAFVSIARSDDAAPLALPAQKMSPDEVDHVNASAQGLAGKEGSGDWTSTKEWQDYEHELDTKWTYLSRIRLNAMKSWSSTALGDIRGKTDTIYYPFSGPDALYVDTLFPDSKTVIMAGLEPVGTMPDLAQLQKDGRLGPYLDDVQKSLYTILTASFFKTKDMKNDFNNNLVDGLMPAMIVFLARQGYHIDDIQFVTLTHDGSLVAKGQGSGAPGVQITYAGGRNMLYFQANISDDGLNANPGYVKLMERLAPGITYLKAASYLCYEDYFSQIRNAILKNSIAVVEDDSGIPFKDFNPAQWDVIPYGDYTGPIALFKDKDQPDLHDFYKKTPHDQLTFGSGYKFSASVSSLLVAKKKS